MPQLAALRWALAAPPPCPRRAVEAEPDGAGLGARARAAASALPAPLGLRAAGGGALRDSLLQTPPLLEALREAPRSDRARRRVSKLFEDQSPGEDKRLGYGQVLALLRQLWSGQLRLSGSVLEDAENDAAALLISLDLDKDGRVGLDEFIDFFAAVTEASEVGAGRGFHSYLLQNWVGDSVSGARLSVPYGVGILGRTALGLSDSMDMLSQDIRYTFRLLNKLLDGEEMDEVEVSMLRRAASDLVTYVPHIAVAMWPLPLYGHAFVFALVKTCAPHLCPSSFGGSRLRLAGALRSVRQHPEYQAWWLFGEGPSEEVDEAVAGILGLGTGDSAARKTGINELFRKLDEHDTGSVTHTQVLSIVQSVWNGRLSLPMLRMDDVRMDATSLMVALDSKGTSLMTLGQFSEFLETLADVVNSYTNEELLNLTSFQADGQKQQAVSSFVSVARAGLVQLVDGLSILARDVQHGARLAFFFLGIRAARGRTLSNMDAAMLNRAGRDALTLVPYAAVYFARTTLFLQILAIVLIWKNVPSCIPSAFSKHRRRLASAWRAIAAKKRERVYADWLSFERSRSSSPDDGAAEPGAQGRAQELFEQHDADGGGTLTYGRALGLVRAAWGGTLRRPHHPGGFVLLDVVALMAQCDRDADGALTLAEFTELHEALQRFSLEPRAAGEAPAGPPARPRGVATGATAPAAVARRCDPGDMDAYRRRLVSFKAPMWFNKPLGASPIECAVRGWRCAGADVAECDCCGGQFRVERHPGKGGWLANGVPVAPADAAAEGGGAAGAAAGAPCGPRAAWAEALIQGHCPFCPWRSHEVLLADQSKLSDREVAEAVEQRLQGLRANLRCVPSIVDVDGEAGTQDGGGLATLARAGWEYAWRMDYDGVSVEYLRCTLCLRAVAAQAFAHRRRSTEGEPPAKAARKADAGAGELLPPEPKLRKLRTPGPQAVPPGAAELLDPFALHRFYCPMYSRPDDRLGEAATRAIRAHAAAAPAEAAEAADGSSGCAPDAAALAADGPEELLRQLGAILPPV
ncbi:unnamed protein product [Prorocentrum cordatum]|uniref:EF-hand domain-containing protein n=1 Tax=Prorocentrum cordatum TaxID=2364126 RepID=A0ABN9VAZ0_9DINO|nr:unnamed protein product [Polarella glacialis]